MRQNIKRHKLRVYKRFDKNNKITQVVASDGLWSLLWYPTIKGYEWLSTNDRDGIYGERREALRAYKQLGDS
jgi:hypothetical protein